MQIFDADTVKRITGKNKLRQYPSPKKGRARMLPFAQPRMQPDLRATPGASFFVGGSCFARNIESALNFADQPVLSSSEQTPMPSPPAEVPKWFNKFNTDTLLNEIRWAVQPEWECGVPTLVEYEGEWSDLQIGWSFAHGREEAEFLRRAYARAYGGAATADIVIITLGSVECWFDNLHGIYLNGMVPGRVAERMPGRFEFHCFDFADAYAAMGRVRDHVMSRPGTPPQLIFAVSAVAQPASYMAQDALVSNMASQAIQRAAAEQFVRDHPDCLYFPAYEYVTLSDRRYSYHENTFNHVQQPVMDRAVANLLEAIMGPNEAASVIATRGLMADFATADMPEKGLEALEKHDATWGDSTALDFFRAQVFYKADRREAAMSYYMRAARSERMGQWSVWQTVVSKALLCNRKSEADEIVALAEQRGNDPERLEQLKLRYEAGLSRVSPQVAADPIPANAPFDGEVPAAETPAPVVETVMPLARQSVPKDEIELLHDRFREMLGADPQGLVDELGPMLEEKDLDDRFAWLFARALGKVDVPRAIEYLRQLCATDFKYKTSATNTLNNLIAQQERLGRPVT
ncbi:GSCFA domain-containing protein [Tropicimonas sp. TH_r6]|uniref:GSCFA domain-containing protein n=1 Tax=Tropicimonas sp. TH_r6 TaxID=3082085 RepID=UPI00295407F0|nr:GSCFA domain-containing protein [Tropicimonas sp. TH_r6]MDV7141315.1 GSCFA domain-containing protein [Tropicimonas sp. TH_r6]